MTPAEKCVSLETARKLQAAGFPQDTHFSWLPVIFSHKETVVERSEPRVVYVEPALVTGEYYLSCDTKEEMRDGIVAAPDAQEIGELLPYSTDSYGLYMQKFHRDWIVYYSMHSWLYDIGGKFPENKPSISANEAEARASAWLYLKENGLFV